MSALLSVRLQNDQDADQVLATRIQRQLSSDSRALTRLQIEVDSGVVTLRGTATSFYQKQLWLHGTKRAIGDDAVINDHISVSANWDNSEFAWRD